MNYAINYQKTGEGFKATFPDFPDVVVLSDTAEQLESDAYDALITKLMMYMEAGQQVPLPQAKGPAQISLLPSIAAKILLQNLAVEQNKSRSWIASQMGVSRQVMTRLFNLRETTKVETIQNALDAMGYEMQISIAPRTQSFQF
ncbi:hypothetical protein EX011_21345 [Salmonella enterica]|nr:hypothetical protein [Salmonella enterica]HAV7961449.1 hypothetical protein [Escherichia coli]